MIRFHGIGASSGIAIGPAVVRRFELPEIVPHKISDPVPEAARLDRAIEAVLARLTMLEERATADAGEGVGEIFEAHRMFLEDPSFSGAARLGKRKSSFSCPSAVAPTGRLAVGFAFERRVGQHVVRFRTQATWLNGAEGDDERTVQERVRVQDAEHELPFRKMY